MTSGHSPHHFLTDLFMRAVEVADPMAVVPGHLPAQPPGRLIVIGAGKASARMAEAVEAELGPCDGLVITRYGYARPTAGIEIVEARHPVPDEAGRGATGRMLDLVAGLGPEDVVIALVSGGGSSLLCAPADGLTLADIASVNEALLASGASIGAMNIVRKHISRVKGGQLAAACYPARCITLMISDVPGDAPTEIASGPTIGEDSSPQDALDIIERYDIRVPDVVLTALATGSTVVPPGDERLSQTENRIVSAPSQSLEAAAKMAHAHGVDVRCLGTDLEGEARSLGARQAQMGMLMQDEVSQTGRPLLLLSGGECTVTRRGQGVGGPNAEFALAAALELDGHPGVHVLACDTDGVDGAAEVAGAYVGPDTTAKAQAAGLDLRAALDHNDAHTVFAGLGDQIVTGPTLTNVNDFRAVLIMPD